MFSLLLLARNLVVDGEAVYMAQVAALEKTWNTLPGTGSEKFPLSFSAQDYLEFEADLQAASLGMEVMREIREVLGDLFPEKGLVRHDQYDEVIDTLSQMRDQVIDQFGSCEQDKEQWRAKWPFDG